MSTIDSFYAIVNGKIVDIVDGNIDWEIDAIPNFDISVYGKYLDYRDIKGRDVKVYKDGQELISGYVIDRPSFKFRDDEQNVYKLKCYGDLGRLSCLKAKTIAHYQDELVIDIITNLLLPYALEWELDYSGFSGALTEKTTIDLRSKETLFAQIVETVKSVPSLHLRYGGISTVNGKKVVEIGDFNTIRHVGRQGDNITKLELNNGSNKGYSVVESFGGFGGTERITLQDSLLDARTTIHPDYVQYPIFYEALTDTYSVVDLNADIECEIAKKFELSKTNNAESPTTAEIAEAGYALWRKTVRFLQQNADRETYKATIISEEPFSLGDRIRVDGDVYEHVYDELSNSIREIQVYSVHDDFKIVKFSIDFERNKRPNELELNYQPSSFIYDMEITNGEDAENYDSELELYDRTENVSTVPNANVLRISNVTSTTLTYDGVLAADCVFSGIPNNGKKYSYPLPTVPSWANNVYFSVSLMSPNARYRVQYYNSTDLINNIDLCVVPSGGDWSTLGAGNTIAVTVSIYFG